MSDTPHVNTALTQYGQTAPMALPSAMQSHVGSPIQENTTPAHVLNDAEKFIFNLKLIDLTDATADPKVVAPVYREIVASILSKHTAAEFNIDWVRATFRPCCCVDTHRREFA